MGGLPKRLHKKGKKQETFFRFYAHRGRRSQRFTAGMLKKMIHTNDAVVKCLN